MLDTLELRQKVIIIVKFNRLVGWLGYMAYQPCSLFNAKFLSICIYI